MAKLCEEIFNRTIFKQELRKLDAVIGLTPCITNNIRRYCGTANSYTIPNGVNCSEFINNINNKIKFRQKYGIPVDRIVVLFTGRFSRVKGISELADAARNIAKINKRVFFVFVGGGILTPELTKKLANIGNSKILGWISQEKIHEVYIASDVFILPSRSEALPLTILEAMAARLDIIATRVGGVPEVLHDYPYKSFIENSSPCEISRHILNRILQVKDDDNKRRSFKCNFLDEYNWEIIADKIYKIYESLCGKDLEIGVLQGDCYFPSQNAVCLKRE